MEAALGMLIAVGVFVVGPAIIGLGILGTVVAREQRRIARAHKYQAAGAAAGKGELVGGPRKTR